MTDITARCRYCGLVMEERLEIGPLYNRETGKVIETILLACPKFPKNGFQAFFRRTHEAYERDHPISAREWR